MIIKGGEWDSCENLAFWELWINCPTQLLLLVVMFLKPPETSVASAARAARATPPHSLDTFGGLRTNSSSLSFGSSFRNLRRSATEAQLGLEFESAPEMEFEFEFLFQPGLKFTFELECEFDLDFEFKSEFVVEVALELELELASSSIHLPVFLPNVKKSTATREKQSLNSIFISILFENYLSGTQNLFQNDPLGGPNGAPVGISL